MPAHYVRCVYHSTISLNGADLVNTFHLEADTLTTPPDYNGIVTDVDAWLTTLYKATVDANTVLHSLTVTEETFPGSIPGQGFKSLEVQGSRSTTDNLCSPALCALLHFATATPKKYSRGRMFMPPVVSSTALGANGSFNQSSSYITAIKAFATAFLAGHTAGSTSYAPVVFSRTRVAQGLTPFAFPILNSRVQTNQYFLRSRLTAP